MSILYSQILRLSDFKIISNSFSRQGSIIQTQNALLKELRTVIQAATQQNVVLSYDSIDKQHTFYIQLIENIALSVITDDVLNDIQAILFQMKEVLSKDPVEQENKMKEIADSYNENRVNIELERAKKQCVESLDHIIMRGEKIDELAFIADQLRNESKKLSQKSKRAYYEEKLKGYTLYAVIFIVIFFLLWFMMR